MDGDASAKLLEVLSQDPERRRRATEDMLRELVVRHPTLAPFSSLLAREAADDSVTEVLAEGVDEDEVEELRDRCDGLAGELAILRRFLGTLASALGACEGCWGTQTSCPNCGGDGGSGTFLPHRRLFEEWVAPAIRRLPQRASRAGPRSARNARTGRDEGGRA